MAENSITRIIKIESHIPLVWLIIIVSCVPYLILTNNGLNALSAWFMPTQLQLSTMWKVWSPTFVHYTLAHLLTNLILFWMFAQKIERESKWQLLVVFCTIAGISNLCQWWFTGPNFGGLSGVAYGMMSYLAVLSYWAGKKNYHIDSTLIILMLVLIPLSFSGAFGRLSNYAHISGLICGMILALIYKVRFINNDS